MSYHVNEKGFYGNFGGAFIPEMLYPNIEELRQNYLKITAEPSFKKEFMSLLIDYVYKCHQIYPYFVNKFFIQKHILKKRKALFNLESPILIILTWG